VRSSALPVTIFTPARTVGSLRYRRSYYRMVAGSAGPLVGFVRPE
jgi:hypothetical protein